METKKCHVSCIVKFKSSHLEEAAYRHMIGVMYGIMVGVSGKPIAKDSRNAERYLLSRWVLYVDMTAEQAEMAKRLIQESYGNVADIKFQIFEIA